MSETTPEHPAMNDGHPSAREYSRAQELLDNLPYLLMIILGAAILVVGSRGQSWGSIAAALYAAYGIAGMAWIVVFLCPYCELYGTRLCPCGYGRLAARLRPRGDPSLFTARFRRHIPVIVPLWFLPVIAGGIAVASRFSWSLAALLAAFFVNAFGILPLVSRRYGCAHCPHKDSCPWMSQAFPLGSPSAGAGHPVPERVEPLPVPLDTEKIRKAYGVLSRGYSAVEGVFEKGMRRQLLAMLGLREGESVLEIGVGSGWALSAMGQAVGESGQVWGLDITPQMLALSRKRLEHAGLSRRTTLVQGDARDLPCPSGRFDAVYMAATLELFDTPDIPKVLGEVKRVLKPTGRLAVASLDRKGHERSAFVRIYEWVHVHFHGIAGCRPIYVERSVEEAGFRIVEHRGVRVCGLAPMMLVVAVSETPPPGSGPPRHGMDVPPNEPPRRGRGVFPSGPRGPF